MQNATPIGLNRTGAQMSPRATPDMVDRVQQPGGGDEAPGHEAGIALIRSEYVAEADPLGSIPPPGTLRGVMTAGLAKLVGRNAEVFVDKMGERLAFERTGVRLYEAFMAKCGDMRGARVRIPLAALERIRAGEARHFRMLTEAIESLGADPTSQTPCADASGVMSHGVMQVLTDPRTTIAHGLEALLTVELVDNASWELLVALAVQAGQEPLADRFRAALSEEQDHLLTVRRWLEREIVGQLG